MTEVTLENMQASEYIKENRHKKGIKIPLCSYSLLERFMRCFILLIYCIVWHLLLALAKQMHRVYQTCPHTLIFIYHIKTTNFTVS